MNKLFISFIVVVVLALAGYVATTQQQKTDEVQTQTSAPTTIPEGDAQIVGGDRDEFGCIGSAGYSWCEAKQKCLRVWEEACEEETGAAIQQVLAKKYSKPLTEVAVTVSKQEGNYATGSVKFGVGGIGEGGMWLAQKPEDAWEVVWDGNGMIDCVKFKKDYSFPNSVLGNFCD